MLTVSVKEISRRIKNPKSNELGPKNNKKKEIRLN